MPRASAKDIFIDINLPQKYWNSKAESFVSNAHLKHLGLSPEYEHEAIHY